MGGRQVEAHGDRQARGDQPLSARRTLQEALRPLGAARVIDAAGFPEWDVSVAARDPHTAAAGVAMLTDSPLVERVAAEGQGFINVRWSPPALDGALQALLEAGRALPEVAGVRAYRRCLDAVWMGGHGRSTIAAEAFPLLLCPPVRALAVRLEWFLEVGGRPPGRRMIRDVIGGVDALYSGLPLLRGDAAVVASRLRVLAAAASAMRIAARAGWVEGFSAVNQKAHGFIGVCPTHGSVSQGAVDDDSQVS